MAADYGIASVISHNGIESNAVATKTVLDRNMGLYRCVIGVGIGVSPF
jgi:hypothetical protein